MVNNINYTFLTEMWENGKDRIKVLNKNNVELGFYKISPSVDIMEIIELYYKYQILNIDTSNPWLTKITINKE